MYYLTWIFFVLIAFGVVACLHDLTKTDSQIESIRHEPNEYRWTKILTVFLNTALACILYQFIQMLGQR